MCWPLQGCANYNELMLVAIPMPPLLASSFAVAPIATSLSPQTQGDSMSFLSPAADAGAHARLRRRQPPGRLARLPPTAAAPRPLPPPHAAQPPPTETAAPRAGPTPPSHPAAERRGRSNRGGQGSWGPPRAGKSPRAGARKVARQRYVPAIPMLVHSLEHASAELGPIGELYCTHKAGCQCLTTATTDGEYEICISGAVFHVVKPL